MELRHLRYFAAVAECESVRGASERLFVTQPAISRQIQDLEDEMGVTLFERHGRGLRLTRAGSAFLDDVVKILNSVEEACRGAQRLAAGMEGSLHLGLVESAGWDGLVPRAIGQLQRDAPLLRIQLTPMSTPQQLAALRTGRIDGGLIYAFDELDADLQSQAIARHDVILAVPESSPLAQRALVSTAELSGESFVMFERSVYPAYYDRLLAACRQVGLTPKIIQQVGSESAVLSLVSAGIGLAIVNSANKSRPPARVRFVPLADLSVPLVLSFVHRSSTDVSGLAQFSKAIQLQSVQ